MILLALLLQTVTPVETAEARFERCVDLATGDAGAGVAEATAWRVAGGGFLARQCLGMSYATLGNFAGAAGAFEEAAREAEFAKDQRSVNYWAQAGNAWLAAGVAAKARAALDAALAGGTLTGLTLGEAYLDRARSGVAVGDLAAARGDLDQALIHAKADPLAWLLSATLARRAGDVVRARTDIVEAARLSPNDAAVELENGNIAALAGDEAGARGSWTKAVTLGGDPAVVKAASTALAQFDAGK